ARLPLRFEAGFERLRGAYVALLAGALARRKTVFVAFAGSVLAAAALVPLVGRDFFPTIDAGQVRLHVTAPPGTRIEETERYFSRVEDAIRRIIPAEDRVTLVDNIGVPDGINLGVTQSSTISAADGEILINLNPKRKGSTEEY